MKTIFQLFISFFKIGAFTIGGGYAMLPLIQKEIVDKRKWISEIDFVDILVLAQIIPGAIAVNTAILVGFRMNKLLGAFVAVIASVLPAFVTILVLAIFFQNFKDNVYVIKIFNGLRPAVVALMIYSVYKILASAKIKWYLYFLLIATVLINYFTNFSPFLIILIVIIASIIIFAIKNKNKNKTLE